MSVAVLIVNYRVYADLDEALASVVPALREQDEVVVVDQDGDETRLAKILARYPRVHAIRSPQNTGFAAAINRAAAATSGQYLLWLNPDARLEGAVIDGLRAWLEWHPETAIVGPRVVNDDGSVQGSARRFPGATAAIAGRSAWLSRRFPANRLTSRNLPGRSADVPVGVDWVAGSCLMTRRAVFEQLGGLDERFFLYWEDADYCRRAADEGLGGCVYLPTVTVRHTGGRSARLNRVAAIRAFHRSAALLHRKHAGPGGQLVSPLVRLALWARGELLVARAGHAPSPALPDERRHGSGDARIDRRGDPEVGVDRHPD